MKFPSCCFFGIAEAVSPVYLSGITTYQQKGLIKRLCLTRLSVLSERRPDKSQAELPG